MTMTERLTRRTVLSLAVLGLSALVPGAQVLAQGERATYDLTDPLPTDSPGKVEVVEFFWYGCPHCYALEPALQSWIEKLPRDVVFKRIPAIFNDNWGASARVYYTLESMGQLNRLHRPFFDALHRDNLRPTFESDLLAWLSANGVDRQQYQAAAKSFAVEGRMKRAAQLIDAARISGVPAIVVQGRHVVNAAHSPQQMLASVDQFIAAERKLLGAAKAAR
jgi:thiol:disulfide interchange protein DsbA